VFRERFGVAGEAFMKHQARVAMSSASASEAKLSNETAQPNGERPDGADASKGRTPGAFGRILGARRTGGAPVLFHFTPRGDGRFEHPPKVCSSDVGTRPRRNLELRSANDGVLIDDVELLRRVARGEANAQRQIACRLLRRVERLCRTLLRNREEALDARQLSIIEILKSAHTFRGEGTLERWADRITVRTALRAVAAERRAQRAPVDFAPSTTRPTGDTILLARQYLALISKRQRRVVVMRHSLEYSIEEIAEMTGISKNGVKDRLLRARGILRRMCRREQFLVSVSKGRIEP
jgi:RNA polymerase sigma-70 factor (ECF subfamily)